MADIARKHVNVMSTNRSNEVGNEKWAKHYSSNHQILVVGDGDFSFSRSLAMSFGSASNIVATSFDYYDDLIRKYKRARSNVELLRHFGAELLHGIDSTNMKLHIDLQIRKFDRIVYNFPHAGFIGKEDDPLVIMIHKNLVRGFFMNASDMLLPNGEVHVTHKTSYPFDCWNIEELATQSGLTLLECVDFEIEDYPGYNNKRGDGMNSDEPFPLGKCNTFKFILSSNAERRQEIPLQRGDGRVAMDPSPIMTKSEECLWILSGQVDDYIPYPVSDAEDIDDLVEAFMDKWEKDKRGQADDYLPYTDSDAKDIDDLAEAFMDKWDKR